MAVGLLLCSAQTSLASVPADPSNFLAHVYGSNWIHFTWQDNSYDELTFSIELYNGAGWDQIDLTAPNATSYDLILYDPLAAGSQYTWRVRSWNNEGFGPGSSNQFTSTTPLQRWDAPSGLTSTVSGDSIVLNWSDNTNLEIGYSIEWRVPNGTWSVLGEIGPVSNIGTTSTPASISMAGVGFSPSTAYQFRVRAMRSNPTVYSGYSNEYQVTMPGLAAPTNLAFTLPAAEQIQLTWTDNSVSEGNYEIQYRFQGETNFSHLDYFNANTTSHTALGVPPVPVEFQVRATYGGGPDSFSPFSNIVTATATFAAPTNLAGSSPGEGKFNVSWTDNSGVEGNYELQVRVKGTSTFLTYDFYAANTTSLTNLPIDPGFIYEFRVCATYGTLAQTKSAFSNIVEITVPFNAPTGLTATPVNDRQINLAWQDNSTVEASYAVLCKQSSASQYSVCAVLPANSTSLQARAEDSDFNFPFAPNTAYDFQLIAISGDGETPALTAAATTKDGTSSDLSPPMFVNESVSHTLAFTEGQGTVTSSSVTGGLPPGVTYDSGTRTFSGTPTSRGAFTPTLQVNWSNGYSNTYTLHLRPIYRPGRPLVNSSIGSQVLTLGGTSTASIPLGTVFSDPDSESAVRIDIPGADGTPAGRSITIILNDSVTPQTVANFMAYLTNAANGYQDTIFQRLVTNFVLQGGSLKSSTAPGAPSNAFVSITKLPAVANEPGLSSTLGTLAMAKQAGNPNSATADFFFNLANNGANLDFQNDGFSVFGRVTQGSLAILSALNSLPLPPASGNPNAPNYAVTIDGQNSFLTQLPTNIIAATGPATIDSSKLLRINSVATNIPLLTRSVSGNTSSAVVTAAINGANLDLTALAPGTSTISLQATDLDGNTLISPLSFTVTVNQTFEHWAAAQGLPSGEEGPTADPDHDGSENLEEWAFLTNPGAANDSHPSFALLTDGADVKGSITFKVRKFAPGITYIVEASGNLGAWTPIWTSADGFGAAVVVSAVDNADHTLVTIKDTVAITSGTPRFLRVKVTSP